jgi:hypothetical protein
VCVLSLAHSKFGVIDAVLNGDTRFADDAAAGTYERVSLILLFWIVKSFICKVRCHFCRVHTDSALVGSVGDSDSVKTLTFTH